MPRDQDGGHTPADLHERFPSVVARIAVHPDDFGGPLRQAVVNDLVRRGFPEANIIVQEGGTGGLARGFFFEIIQLVRGEARITFEGDLVLAILPDGRDKLEDHFAKIKNPVRCAAFKSALTAPVGASSGRSPP